MIWAGPVAPDFGAVEGTGLYSIVGALLTVTLIAAVTMLIVCAVWWVFALHAANWHEASKARVGTLLSLAGAALTGGTIALANWLLSLAAGV